jgi:hypothetical protein
VLAITSSVVYIDKNVRTKAGKTSKGNFCSKKSGLRRNILTAAALIATFVTARKFDFLNFPSEPRFYAAFLCNEALQ